MTILTVLAVVLAGSLLFWWLNGPRPSGSKPDEAAHAAREALERQAAARRERNVATWKSIIDNLPVVDATQSALYHTPLYDCVADRFELPCQHSSYDRFAGQKHLGMPFGLLLRPELDQTLAEFAVRATGSIVFVASGDAAYLIYSDEPALPGALVMRVVRTGPAQFMAYGWRTGVRVEPGAIDPPLLVQDLCADPELWTERLKQQEAAWAENADYRAELRRCPHNLAIKAA